MVCLQKHQAGIEAARNRQPMICKDPRATFIDTLIAEGFKGVHTIIPEKFQRYDTADCKRGKIPAWSIYYEIEIDGGVIGHGTYGNFQTGFTQNWSSISEHQMNTTERTQYHAQREAIKVQRETEEKQRHAEAANDAFNTWIKAPQTETHEYLKNKGVKTATGLKTADDGRLIIPIAVNNEIVSLQFIAGDGTKRFLTGGRLKGGWFMIEGDSTTIYIAEGYSTAASVHEATGATTYIAFNAGNLYEVAAYAKNKHSESQIIIAGDDDAESIGNVGRTKAEQTAQRLNIHCMFPEGFNDFNDLHQAKGLDAVRNEIDKASDIEHWPDPEEINPELLPVQEFNADQLLPTILRNWVMDTANRMSCAPDFVATAAIVGLGSVIGAGCGIKPKKFDDWVVCPNLWGGCVSPPSSKKTPAISKAFKPLDHLICIARKHHAEKMNSFETEKLASDAKKKALKKNLDEEAKKEDGDMKAVINKITTLDQIMPQEPILRRYKTNDATVEKIGEMLSENPRGMIMLRDELVGLLATWEKKGHEGDRTFYLEGWNGFGSYDTDRIGRGSIFIDNLCISIFGGTQPDKLLAFLRQTADALANDGAMQRFQMLVFPDPYKWEYVDRVPDKKARDKIYDLFEQISDLNPVSIGANPIDQYNNWPYFHFSDEAQPFFKEWTIELNTKKISYEDNKLIVEHLGKYDKLFCALALIFHIVDCVAHKKTGKVSLNAVTMAASWCEYLETHARRCYGLLVDSTMFAAQHLIQKIQNGKLNDSFTLNDIKRKGWSGLTKKEDVQEALEWLEDTNWIKGHNTQSTSVGGRTTRKYKINPKALN